MSAGATTIDERSAPTNGSAAPANGTRSAAARATLAVDVRLVRRYRDGDRQARETLITRHLPLARSLARRYRGATVPFEDLLQVASLGLVKAVDRWDPDRGLGFTTYAVPTIVGELRHYLRDATWIVRPPRPLMDLRASVERSRQPLIAAIGREPTVAELAEHVGRPEAAVEEALRAADARSICSLDSPIRGHAPADLLGANDSAYEQVEARATLERLFALLDDRERQILHLRFVDDLLQSEIAQRVGCSQTHVSRVIRTALEQLSAHASADRRR